MIQLYSFLKIFLILSLRFIVILGYANSIDTNVSDGTNWHAKYFPYGPGEVDTNPVILDESRFKMLSDIDPACDNGKMNLNIDWDGVPFTHTCYVSKLYPDLFTKPTLTCKNIPKMYSAMHVCMNNSITYEENIPTFGAHRPVWAQYGEYKYLPQQRWLHNVEHGAVIMLYHPCADKSEVQRLKSIVRNCLYRHVITSSPYTSEERPLVLVTWGCRFEMSYVHAPLVRAFILNHALRGSEQISRNGIYNESLIQPAEIISNMEDTNLCPSTQGM